MDLVARNGGVSMESVYQAVVYHVAAQPGLAASALARSEPPPSVMGAGAGNGTSCGAAAVVVVVRSWSSCRRRWHGCRQRRRQRAGE